MNKFFAGDAFLNAIGPVSSSWLKIIGDWLVIAREEQVKTGTRVPINAVMGAVRLPPKPEDAVPHLKYSVQLVPLSSVIHLEPQIPLTFVDLDWVPNNLPELFDLTVFKHIISPPKILPFTCERGAQCPQKEAKQLPGNEAEVIDGRNLLVSGETGPKPNAGGADRENSVLPSW